MEEFDISRDNRLLRERTYDFAKSTEKTDRFVGFAIFYSLVCLLGICAIALGSYMLIIGDKWWGHTIADFVLGGILTLGAYPAFINDTASCFDRMNYED